MNSINYICKNRVNLFQDGTSWNFAQIRKANP
jgi:hypothetical protein